MWYNTYAGQGLPEELGKYIWLAKTDTSQETPYSIIGSSLPVITNDNIFYLFFQQKKQEFYFLPLFIIFRKGTLLHHRRHRILLPAPPF